MRFFGLSLTSVLILGLFFWLGTKFPNVFGGLPILGK